MSISLLLAFSFAAMSSFSFNCKAVVSLFCDCWMIKTMRKVMIVVPVLMTSCHVSEYLNIGPVRAQMMITRNAIISAAGRPVALVTLVEKVLYRRAHFS